MLLIVDKSRKNGKALRQIAYLLDILSYSVKPYEFLKEVSPFYSAILMIDPDSYNEDREYFEKIHKYKLGMPIFALKTEKFSSKCDEYFDEIFYYKFSSITINDMISYAKRNSLRPIGEYCGFGIQASFDYIYPEFFEETMRTTKTETMILRFLLRVYPNPMNAFNILKYAFKAGKQIDLASIRTHISLLNKNCRPVAEKNIIEFVPKQGYTISAPKLNEEYLNTIFSKQEIDSIT